MQWARKQTGFTIVELLIVVVVIAILAAITIVAYNGISERARASAAASYAIQLKKRDIVAAQGYWSFDECSGSTVANSAGNATTPSSTISGSVSWSSDTPSGSGCSLYFNGSSTLINTGVLLSNEYYMKSAWIKTNWSGNIISDSGGNNAAFYLTSGRVNSGHNGSWSQTGSTNTYNDGKWHFVTAEFVKNSTTTGSLTLTVDGTVVASNQSVPLMASTPLREQLIGSYNNGNYFTGLIDDVLIVVK